MPSLYFLWYLPSPDPDGMDESKRNDTKQVIMLLSQRVASEQTSMHSSFGNIYS